MMTRLLVYGSREWKLYESMGWRTSLAKEAKAYSPAVAESFGPHTVVASMSYAPGPINCWTGGLPHPSQVVAWALSIAETEID